MKMASLIDKIKTNQVLYLVYYFTLSFFVNFIKLFVKTDDKLILFVSYGGRYFNDSPRTIYDYMKTDRRFSDYKLVWAFRNVKEYADVDAVKIDSIKYYITALKARCWITNNMVERALNFKGKKTYYFHTTHVTLPKLMGYDAEKLNNFRSRSKYKYDCSCAQSKYEGKLQLSMFGLKSDQVLLCGYPKNDRLAHVTQVERDNIRNKLGINSNRIVILYAPTYRENNLSEMKSPVDFTRWRNRLGDNYLVLFRAHPVVANVTEFDPDDDFIRDVSAYPDNVELMIASDLLVSDYSGIFFEYAVLNKPMYCFAYDYDEYTKLRPLYFDIRKELPSGEENEVLEMICNQRSCDMEMIKHFREKYVTFYGNATKQAVNNIYNNIAILD